MTHVDAIRRQRGDGDIATHGARQVAVDDSVVEQIFQHRGDGRDGERTAHGRPPLPRYSSKDIFGAAGITRGTGGAGSTARTSTRPMVTRIVGADSCAASWRSRFCDGAGAGVSRWSATIE